MKLWLLRPIPNASRAFDKWDVMQGFVVRARSESEARVLADANHGFEGMGAWLNTDITTCVPIPREGEAEVILSDYKAG